MLNTIRIHFKLPKSINIWDFYIIYINLYNVSQVCRIWFHVRKTKQIDNRSVF